MLFFFLLFCGERIVEDERDEGLLGGACSMGLPVGPTPQGKLDRRWALYGSPVGPRPPGKPS
jgi:hypothetical protein